MKKAVVAILCLALSMRLCAQTDSLDRYAGLDSLLTQFYTALERVDVPAKNAELDALIETCRDSLMRQHVALRIFEHYRNARIMGEEAVAVHVYDRWIASGIVKTRSEFEQMDVELFAEFNRHSLIGMQAPEVSLFKPGGGRMTVPQKGRVAVLFFYDTSCAKCRLEARFLPQILGEAEFPLDFYAVYSSSDRRDWRAFRRNFKVPGRNVRTYHLWDPEVDSDYQRMYGVIGTPRLFVVLEDGEIIGRRLETVNLQEIIKILNLAHGEIGKK